MIQELLGVELDGYKIGEFTEVFGNDKRGNRISKGLFTDQDVIAAFLSLQPKEIARSLSVRRVFALYNVDQLHDFEYSIEKETTKAVILGEIVEFADEGEIASVIRGQGLKKLDPLEKKFLFEKDQE